MKKEYEQNETEVPSVAEPDVSGQKILERDCYTVEECRSRLLNLVRSHYGVQ